MLSLTNLMGGFFLKALGFKQPWASPAPAVLWLSAVLWRFSDCSLLESLRLTAVLDVLIIRNFARLELFVSHRHSIDLDLLPAQKLSSLHFRDKNHGNPKAIA